MSPSTQPPLFALGWTTEVDDIAISAVLVERSRLGLATIWVMWRTYTVFVAMRDATVLPPASASLALGLAFRV
jgi:hypothetical protein